MRTLLFSTVFLLFAACNSGENKLEGCYRINDSKYNVEMQINSQDEDVAGTLNYAIAEKDANSGTFHGTFEKDVLIADYSFMSEGVTSMRQLAFKKMGEELWEGYGEMKEENGKMVFVNPGAIKFGDGIILKQQPCQK